MLPPTVTAVEAQQVNAGPLCSHCFSDKQEEILPVHSF
jgi:hypothetical protein